MSKSRFKHSSIAWLLSLALIAMASFQSLHELVDHSQVEHCEVCLAVQSQDLDSVLPALVVIPTVIADFAPQILLAVFSPSNIDLAPSARAPPVLQTASAE